MIRAKEALRELLAKATAATGRFCRGGFETPYNISSLLQTGGV